MSKVIAFVPVRGGSKSIPHKNIKNICGKPLVFWCLSALQNSLSIDQIIVATDCQVIKSIIDKFNFSKVSIYQRSQESASDTASTEFVILEFLQSSFSAKYQMDDIFVLVQATSPLIYSSDFDSALKSYINSDYDSMLSGVNTKRFFWGTSGPINYDYENRPRRQDFQGLLMENGAFYISRIKSILKSKNRISGKIGYYEMPDYTGFEIDEPSDWIVLESLMYRYSRYFHEEGLKNVKLVISDVDGVLTNSGMTYSSDDEFKTFSARDGLGFQLLRFNNIKTAIITSEITELVERRAKKLKVDYLYQGCFGLGKLDAAVKICENSGISLSEVAFIGDDLNDIPLLNKVLFSGCPADASDFVRANVSVVLNENGGRGAFRAFAELILGRDRINQFIAQL